MEGIFFYWIMWLAWIVTTFLMKKNKLRVKLSIFLMITILLSKYYVIVGDYTIRVSLFLFLFLGYYLAVKQKQQKSLSLLIMTLTLTFAYSGILLFRVYDPVWFFVDYRLLVSVLIGVLAIYLGKQPIHRFALCMISICQGEFLYWMILGKFYDGLTIGTATCLDMLVIGCLIIFLWMVTEHIITTLEHTLQKPAKEKQG